MRKSKRKPRGKLMSLNNKSFKQRELPHKRIGKLGQLNIELYNLRERLKRLIK